MRVGGALAGLDGGLSLENKGGDKDGIRGGHQGIGDRGGEGVQGEPNISHDELADEQSEVNPKVHFPPDGLVNFLPDELVNQSDPEISSIKNEIQCTKKNVIQGDQKDKTHRYEEQYEVQGVQEENKESMIQSEPSVQGVQEVKKISERETQGEHDVGGIQGV